MAQAEQPSWKRHLATFYDPAPVGLSLMDRELRWLRINERLAAINGLPIGAHIGVRQAELIPDINRSVEEAQLSGLRTGKSVLGIEVGGTTPSEPDRQRDWIVDYYPVFSGEEVFALAAACAR